MAPACAVRFGMKAEIGALLVLVAELAILNFRPGPEVGYPQLETAHRVLGVLGHGLGARATPAATLAAAICHDDAAGLAWS